MLGSGRNLGAAALGLVAGASLCHAAALEPIGAWPLAWVAAAPLCLAAALLPPGRAALAGQGFGALTAFLVAPWLARLMTDYFLLPPTWSLAAAGAVWVLSAGPFFAALALWLSWAVRRAPVSPLLVGAAWGVGEWLRVRAGLANPWGLLSGAQLGWLPGAQALDLLGPYGLAMAMATVGATFAGLVQPRLAGRHPRAQRVAVAAGVLALVGYGTWRFGAEPAGGPSLSVRLVQGAIPRAERWKRESASTNLERYLALSADGAAPRPALVLWPELAMEFYVEGDARLRRRLGAVAREGTALLAGGLGAAHRSGERRRVPTNAVFLVEEGRVRARYDKEELVPFSEERRFGLEATGGFFAGRAGKPLATSLGSVGVLLCSEILDPSLARARVAAGAGLLANPANDDWYGSAGAARQALAVARARAIETRRWLVRPTTTGYTVVIDPQGRVTAEAPFGRPATLAAEVRFADERSPYLRVGDWIVAAAALALGADAIWRGRA